MPVAANTLRGALMLGVALVAATGAVAQDAVKIQIGNGQKEFPESVTSTADGTLYVGSLTTGVIYKAAPGATTAEVWIEAPTEGPKAGLGVYADEANGTLWACFIDMGAFGGQATTPSVLRSFDLASGEEKASYSFPDNNSACNDIATTADGTAYAADTAGARIIRVAPGATEAEVWLADEALAGVDGLSFGPDGALYVNSVTANKLFRIDVGADGTAGAITELTTSEPLKGPDGMRFGDDGKLYLAENANGRVDEVTIDGDTATIKPLPGEQYNGATAVTKVGDTLWVLETKLSMLGGEQDPGIFYVYPVALAAAD